MKENKIVKTNNMDVKRDRFVRIAERRVNKVIDGIDSLGKCSNKKNYEYTSDDVKKIFNAIERKIKEIKILYQNSNERRKFKL